jgi:hypothetical protein
MMRFPDPTKEQHQILCRSRQKCYRCCASDRQSFREESLGREPYTDARMKCSARDRPKMARQVNSKVFFDIKGTVHQGLFDQKRHYCRPPPSYFSVSLLITNNSVALVRERTTPTEQPPLVDASICG